ncbi:MAG: Fic family protein [Acidobacteria bacterium]|nr:Fic family protein [Acidobacteriota bacterium]
MDWNWQQSDWPHFSWDAQVLRQAEEQFLLGGGLLAGVFKHLQQQDCYEVTVEASCDEAVITSEIEGVLLDRASVQSSIRKQLGLPTDRTRIPAAERGVAEMAVDAMRGFQNELTEDRLFTWHRMLFADQHRASGGGVLHQVGCYRKGRLDMEIVSGPVHARRVHFVAPPATRVPGEMARFLDWFRDSGLPGVTRAGLAHLYFESIHPFEDGNGRIGRIISATALAQAVGEPVPIALAATILSRRREYYVALESGSRSNEVTAWLRWFAGVVLEAQRRTTAQVEFLLDKTRLIDRMRDQWNARQEKAMLRMFREGPDGFQGGLSAGNYAAITGASAATATRDLADLVEKGALLRTGERRHTRYWLAIPERSAAPVRIDESGGIQ